MVEKKTLEEEQAEIKLEEERIAKETANASEANSKTMIDKANDAAERLEAANTKQEELLKRQEAAKVQDTLGGKAEAGTGSAETISDEDYAKKALANDIEKKNE